MQEFRFCPLCRTELVWAERGGASRQMCPGGDCGYVAWNNPAPVVGAIVEQAGRIILVRSRGWPDGYYGLVAGFIEAGEVPGDAALREVAEEIGIQAELASYVGTYPFPERNQLIFVYHIEVPPAEIRLCEEELTDYRAVPIERVVPWSRGTGPALRDWLATRGFNREMVDFGRHLHSDKSDGA
jgi:NADH pyrophosphatase NudC (nudix superfamily)